MDLMQLQYFRTIARLENLTRASEQLYVAQSNLSVSITRLERDLGVALFDRQRGKIRLTPTGRLFLEYIDRMFDDLDEGIERIRALDRAANGQIRVANSIVDLVGNLLMEFYPRSDGISFHQITCRNREIPDKVLSGEADFGFLFGMPTVAGLEYTPLDRCERVVQLARSHPLAEKGSVRLRELEGQRLICNRARDDDEFLADLTRRGLFHPSIFYECDDNRVEVSMTLSGGGLSIAPLSNYLKLLRGDPALPLTCLRLPDSVPDVQLGMIRRSGGLLSGAAFAFYQMVDEFFRQEAAIAQEFRERTGFG